MRVQDKAVWGEGSGFEGSGYRVQEGSGYRVEGTALGRKKSSPEALIISTDSGARLSEMPRNDDTTLSGRGI